MMLTMKNSQKNQDEFQPVMDVFDRSPLRKIIQKAKFLLALDHALQAILPESFRSYCHVMNVNEGNVVLGVSNAAIATRIQFMSIAIMSELKKTREYAQLLGIKCKVCAKTVKY